MLVVIQTDFLNQKIKKRHEWRYKIGFDNVQKRKKRLIKISESLINLIVAVSILILMLLSEFLLPYIMTWSRSCPFKDIMTFWYF